MKTLLLVALGGGMGSVARYSIGMGMRNIGSLPWGTWFVNILGSFLLGFLAGYLVDSEMDPAVRAGLTVGVLGGFTTFSTWTVETVELFGTGEYGLAVGNLLGAIVVGVAAAGMGLMFGRLVRA